MKIKNIKDVEGFFHILCECKGDVMLVTGAGDRINLKANLCMHLEMMDIFKDPEIKDIEIITHEPEDAYMIREYLVRAWEETQWAHSNSSTQSA